MSDLGARTGPAPQARVGTSGWSYRHWRDVFYPAGLAASGWLAHYAQSFTTVELNASFYRVPKAETFAHWRDATPEGFLFAVKVDRRITHYGKLEGVESLWRDFLARCENLGERLGCLLFQFPATFGPDVDCLRRFLDLVDPRLRCAFEFRHPAWFCEDVYRALEQYGQALCRASSPFSDPEGPPGWPDVDVTTADFVYVRMHGSGSLYSSCYTDDELKKWAAQLRPHLRAGRDVFVYFNNDAKGYAVQNAMLLQRLLRRGRRTC